MARGADQASTLRKVYHDRTGVFGPEDPWFETRSRAFWDDALTTQGFAAACGDERFSRAHRGLFVVRAHEAEVTVLADLWSGAELIVGRLDETQALALAHARSAIDGRVVGARSAAAELVLLPGAYHHSPDALEPIYAVLVEARARALTTEDALDALMRMDLVYRSSSRVKVGFAYRVEGLTRPR